MLGSKDSLCDVHDLNNISPMEVHIRRLCQMLQIALCGEPISKFSSSILNWRPKHAGGAGRLPPRTAARGASAKSLPKGQSEDAGLERPHTLDHEDINRKHQVTN